MNLDYKYQGRHVTQAEAARLMYISRQAIAAAIKRGDIPLTDAGIPVMELDRWRKQRIREAQLYVEELQAVPEIME